MYIHNPRICLQHVNMYLSMLVLKALCTMVPLKIDSFWRLQTLYKLITWLTSAQCTYMYVYTLCTHRGSNLYIKRVCISISFLSLTIHLNHLYSWILKVFHYVIPVHRLLQFNDKTYRYMNNIVRMATHWTHHNLSGAFFIDKTSIFFNKSFSH